MISVQVKPNYFQVKHNSGGQFHKSFNAGDFYWHENTIKIVLAFKTPFFWHQISSMCCQLKDFCCPFWRFSESTLAFLNLNWYYEIEYCTRHHFSGCENFGIKFFMKLNIENAKNILAF